MIAELGHFALVLALALALVQSIVPFAGALQRRRAADGRRAHRPRSTLFLLVGLAFAALVHAYVVSDFSVLNVAENSHLAAAAALQDAPASGATTRARCCCGC